MGHRQTLVAAVLGASLCSARALALDPARSLSGCSVETWRSRDGLAGWVRAIAQTPEGYLWIGTSAGLFRYGGGRMVALELPGGLGRAIDVAGLVVALDGTLRVTPVRGGPVCARDGVLADCPPSGLPGEAIPPARSPPAIEDHDGNVWSGSRSGLTRSRAGAGSVTYTRADGLPEDDVTAVFEDREGSLWVGTRGGGLAQFTDRTLDGQAGPPSLRDRWISSLAEDAAGALWLGTRTGLTRWQDGGERTFTRADGLPADGILAVHPGRPGELWVGTEAGVARLRDGRVDVPAPFAAPATALYLDHDGVLWIGTADGLARLVNGRIERLPVEPGLELNQIRAIQHDDRGTLWLSAGGKPLRVVAGRVQRPPPQDPFIGKVRAMHRDDEGSLWLGTGDGLYRYRGGTWRRFTAQQGLVPQDLYQVVSDDRFLWAGTSQGILRISRRSLDEVEAGRRRLLEVVTFQISDRRRQVEAVSVHQPGVWKRRDGQLWFATSRGAVSADPARLRVNTLPPSVLIEEASVDGRPVGKGAPGAFPPGAGALEFHFAAITLIEPHKALHRYRLEGFDPDWVEAGTRRVAYYTNIAPGRYRFRVQACNADGVWNEAGAAVDFTLAPHFFQTWWFYALLLLTAAGLVFSVHRLRVAQVQSGYAATSAERNRVARDLHDSLLQGMAAARLHLQGLRKRLAREGSGGLQAVTGELRKVEALIGASIGETRQLVWDLREQTSLPAGIEPALGQMIRRVAEGSSVVVQLFAEGVVPPLPPHVTRELLRIAQEALGNALEHARAGRVEVRLHCDDDTVRLSVHDDGCGFDPAQAPGAASGHFGLVGMRERAASIGAFALQSRPGQGTRVEVTVNRRELRDG